MRKIFTLALILSLASIAYAAPVKQCGCNGQDCDCGPACPCGKQVAYAPTPESYVNPPCTTYAEAYARAVKEQKPLLVFVRRTPYDYAGAVTVAVENFEGFTSLSGIVVAKPALDGKKLWRVGDFGPDFTVVQIKTALRRCPECENAAAETSGGCGSVRYFNYGGSCASGGCSSCGGRR